MRTILIAYAVTAVIFFAFDMVWLGSTMSSFYKPRLAGLLLDKPNLAAGGAFYLLYVAGIVFFAVYPAVRNGGWPQALLSGAVLGFIAYATYDLTNLATLRGFSSTLAFVDMAWGTIATGAAASLASLAVVKLNG
jgi:uncharacterized membrane protein